MSKRHQPKTQGAEWLGYSLIAFNGTRYCDKSSPEAFVNSYRAYKLQKRDMNAYDLADQHRDLAIEVAAGLMGIRH